MTILLLIVGYLIGALLTAAGLLRWPPFGALDAREEDAYAIATAFLGFVWPVTALVLVGCFLVTCFIKAATWLARLRIEGVAPHEPA